MRGMKVEMRQIPEICAGIPIPGGPETPFSLEGAPQRLKAQGVEEMSVRELLLITAQNKQGPTLAQSFPRPGGPRV
jgi:hypothetical protein